MARIAVALALKRTKCRVDVSYSTFITGTCDCSLVRGQKLYVEQGPDEASQETAHHDTPALQHGKILADHGKVALVEVTKRRKL